MTDLLDDALAAQLGRPLYDAINKHLADGQRAEEAIGRVRQLAAGQQVEGTDGEQCDADTLWPSEILAALDADDPANNGEQSPRTIPDNSPTSIDADGPSVAECRRDDLRWPLESEGE